MNLSCHEDWVWIVLASLWERWRPELASMEQVNDKMQAGYAPRKGGDPVKACTIWVETWHAILDIMKRSGIDSLDAFDDRFGGVNCVFNWVQDFETELHIILDRLATVYEETARPRDAEPVREEIQRLDLNNAPTAVKPTRASAEGAARTAGQGLSRPPPWDPEDLPATGSRLRAGPLTGKPKVGRNERCPCGSGKKFKKCCGRGG